MDSMFAEVDGFLRVVVIFVFDSLHMCYFCEALILLLYVLLVAFYFLLVFYCSLCSS